MSNAFFSSFKVLLSMLTMVAAAGATPVSVTGSGAGSFVAASGSLSGHFDANAGIAALGMGPNAQATAGMVTFQFSDNIDNWVSSTSYGEFLLSDNAGHLSWLYNSTFTYFDAEEQAAVKVGGTTSSAGSNYFFDLMDGYPVLKTTPSCFLGNCHPVPVTRWACNYLGCSYVPVYTSSTDVYKGYRGDFSVSMSLDALALADIQTDGILDFQMSSTLGDFNFLSATLTLNVEAASAPPDPLPTEPPRGSNVPEPGTLALFGLAAAGLGLTRRMAKHA